MMPENELVTSIETKGGKRLDLRRETVRVLRASVSAVKVAWPSDLSDECELSDTCDPSETCEPN